MPWPHPDSESGRSLSAGVIDEIIRAIGRLPLFEFQPSLGHLHQRHLLNKVFGQIKIHAIPFRQLGGKLDRSTWLVRGATQDNMA